VGNGGRRGEVALDLVRARLGWLARRRRVRRLCRLAAKVARRNHAAARDERQQQEPQANAQQHGSAADRGSPPVYQKHGIGGEWPQRERRGELRWVAIARSAPSPNQRAAEGLLPRHGEGEFAVADAPGKTLGETRRRLLAVGRDEFGKGGEQARLRQAVPIDTVEARFGPGCVEVAERSPFLLMVRSLSRNLDHLCCHAHADSGPPLRGGTLARDARAPRRNWGNG